MFNFLNQKKQIKTELQHQLKQTDMKLALMNAEMAAQLVRLAGQSNELAPLQEAEEAILSARQYYTYETTPIEICMVQGALGDMLLKLGREKSDQGAIARARQAYRAAITLASMHGDEKFRNDLRLKMKVAETLLGQRKQTPSLFKVA